MRIRSAILDARHTSNRKDEILRALMNDIMNKRLFIRTNSGMLVAVSEITGTYDPKEIATLLKIREEDFDAMVAANMMEVDAVEVAADEGDGKFNLHEVGQ